MKKNYLIIILIALIPFSSFGQKKNDLIQEIYAYKKGVVSNASYDNKRIDVWNAMYIIATEEYKIISRESESRGYIEAKEETNTHREAMTFELRGDEPPYRVSFQVTNQERRKKQDDGTYTNWENYRSSNISSYITRLQLRLYELLKGELKLPDELQDKIDKFNSLQKKDKKKVLKGRDY